MKFTYSALFSLGANLYEWEHVSPDRLSNLELASRFINYLAARGLNLDSVHDVTICDDDGWPLVGCSSAAMLADHLSGLHPFPTEKTSTQ